jgi:hypothetical protein
MENGEREKKPRWCINEDGDGEGDRTLKMLSKTCLYLLRLEYYVVVGEFLRGFSEISG